jgi:hypothetical protein
MSDAAAGLFGEIFNFPGQRTQLNSYISSSTPGRYTMPLAVHAFTGDLAGSGDIRVTARTFAIGVSPIPEPRAWAMLAAGLALVLIRIKRCIVAPTPSARAREQCCYQKRHNYLHLG